VPSGPRTYVALGDSFTSAPLVPVTDVADGCFRSGANYPTLVAAELGADLVDRSCGSARIRDLGASQFPGVLPQLEALGPGVDLVTIGIGGNDEETFARLTRRCPALRASDPDGAPCRAAMSRNGRDVLLTALDRTRTRLTAALREVQRRAPDAQVLVIGYPQIVDAGTVCDELPLARGDYAYAERINRALTEALRAAAQQTGSTYVDVWSASEGHDICSDDPWVNGSVPDQRRAAAYHPFAEEQAAVAELVVAAARG
jgi:lysophospholipase L1-like esterase